MPSFYLQFRKNLKILAILELIEYEFVTSWNIFTEHTRETCFLSGFLSCNCSFGSSNKLKLIVLLCWLIASQNKLGYLQPPTSITL